jgi:hypothetical protein
MARAQVAGDGGRDDIGPMLHQELDRLPERYREPIVLCDLEGQTHEQAARHLGWPVGTVKSRLARGRERLRERLTRRGLTPSCAPSGGTLAPASCSMDMPSTLVDATARAASWFKGSKAFAAGMVPARVMTLIWMEQASMVLSKLRAYAAVLLVAGGIATGAGFLAQQAPVAAQSPGSMGGLPGHEAPPKTSAVPQWLEIEQLTDGRVGFSIRWPGSPSRGTILEPLPGDKFRLISKNEDGTESILHCSRIRLNIKDDEIAVMGAATIQQLGRSDGVAGPPRERSDQETRLREVERKLDQVLRTLESLAREQHRNREPAHTSESPSAR